MMQKMVLVVSILTSIMKCTKEDGTKDTGVAVLDAATAARARAHVDAPAGNPDSVSCPEAEALPFELVFGFLFEVKNHEELPIPKGIHPGLYNVEVFALSADEVGAEEVPTAVHWNNLTDKVLDLKVLGARNDFAVPIVKMDIIDTPSKLEEPWTELQACAYVCDLPFCDVCEQQVCSNKIKVFGVIDLGGQWLMDSAAIPFTVEFPVAQEGRVLYTYFEGYEGEIIGREVTFTAGEYKYVGIVADNRLVVSGTIVNWQTGKVIGPWTATKK